jgi:ankyrin repeat protein
MSNVSPEWYQFRDALEEGDFSAAAALLEADPDLLDARNGIGETVLHFLAIENHQAALQWLADRGAELNPENNFGTPLLFEVGLIDNRDVFLWLVQHGADVRRKNRDGQSVLEYLSDFQKPEMAAWIKEHVTPAG